MKIAPTFYFIVLCIYKSDSKCYKHLRIDLNVVDIDLLLYGSANYTYDINCDIFRAVHVFINASGRL